MRKVLLLAILGLSALLGRAAPLHAQPYGLPPGSYLRQCTRLYMEGQFLHGWCRGQYGAGESSINVESCSTDIFVDPSGALTCVGPGGGAPPANAPPPTYEPRYPPRPDYSRPDYPPPPDYSAPPDYSPEPGDRAPPPRDYPPPDEGPDAPD